MVTLDRVRAEVENAKSWIKSQYWTSTQVAGWVKNNFFPVSNHAKVSKGASSAGLPFVLNASGKIDNSFYDVILLNDSNFELYDSADPTRKMKFQLNGITAGNTRLLTVPDADIIIAGRNNAETLTNKTLTTPTIGSFVNATHGHTDAAGGGDLSNVFLRVNGPSSLGSSADMYRFMADVADIGSTQTITLDVTTSSTDDSQFFTEWVVVFGRNSGNAVFCTGKFSASWFVASIGGSATLHSWEGQYSMSGTATNAGITAITNGVRLTLQSSGYGNTLNENVAVITTIGMTADTSLTHTVTIS